MYILFDIGGTNMRIAAAEDTQSFSSPVVVKTPVSFEDGIAELARVIKEFSGGKTIKAISGGMPGPLRRDKRGIENSPNLPKWNKKPFAEKLEELFNAPVYFENDAALAGLGEAHTGAGKGFSVVQYTTISTGVGGARITDGMIDKTASGFEPGSGYLYAGKTQGTFEELVSGAAIERRYKKHPSRIVNPKIWERVAEITAYGVHNAIVHWSPDVVVVGGAMLNQPGIKIERVEYHLKRIMKIFPELPPIRKALLGDLAGLYGAQVYLKQRLGDSPWSRLRIFG